jgi:hypothetical protein
MDRHSSSHAASTIQSSAVPSGQRTPDGLSGSSLSPSEVHATIEQEATMRFGWIVLLQQADQVSE